MNTIISRVRAASHHMGLDTGEILVSARTLIGRVLWILFPASRSMIHSVDVDCDMHPWGSKWRRLRIDDRRYCTHCRSVHPSDFLDAVEDLTRWDPSLALEETHALIRRGEMDNTIRNHLGWRHPAEGTMTCAIHGVDADDDLTLVVHTGDHESFFLRISHIAELSQWEFERFSAWVTETLPELRVTRYGMCVESYYDSSVDPNRHVPTPFLVHPVHGMGPTEDEDDIGC